MRIKILAFLFFFIADFYPGKELYAGSGKGNGFIENKGQIVDQHYKPNQYVLFLLNNSGLNIQLRKTGFSYDVYTVEYKKNPHPVSSGIHDPLRPASLSDSLIPEYLFHRVDITLEGANPGCQIIPSVQLPGYFNYFTASTPSEGIKNVRQYNKITYKNIYPGIDLEFFTNAEHGYKYNFVIHPGADIKDIRLRIQGPDHISLIRDTLKFGTRFGDLEEVIPESYYIINDSRMDIKASFNRIKENVFGFSTDDKYPKNSLLVIDPTAIRLWGTYYGGANDDYSNACAVDQWGNVFLAGSTSSANNIASTGSYQDACAGNYDAFLARFNAAGQRLWGTYIGGPDLDVAISCNVDISGNIYITGITKSVSGIASPGGHQKVYGGGISDCFLEKFNQAGIRLWGTYYGGSDEEEDGFVTTDQYENVFLVGSTASDTGIATPGAYQQNKLGMNAFLTKFDSAGTRLWGTYYGGIHGEFGTCCVTDHSGNVYFSGSATSDSIIASPGAYQTTYGGGINDAFLAKFTTGGERIWATFYGGGGDDGGSGLSVDSSENAIMVGGTTSLDGIASPGSFQPDYGGGAYPGDAFLVKFDSNGQRLWASYYGGSQADVANSSTIGSNNEIFMTGHTNSTNNISTPDSYQPGLGGGADGFLVKFNAGGQRLWGTYYGGSGYENFHCTNYVLDDTIYVAGKTSSTQSITSPGAWQEVYGGGLMIVC